MFEKFLNKKVKIITLGQGFIQGTVTRLDDNFIELDHKGMDIVVQIKYITMIYSL